MRQIERFLSLGFIFAIAAGCGGPESADSKAAPAAKIANAVKESDLTTLTLSAEAVARLGLETVKAEIRAVPRVLKLGGEIIARPGSEALVAAPFAGVVLAPKDKPLPLPGTRLARGQSILRLLPLPSDKDLIGARNDLGVKQAQYEAAAGKAGRTAELLKDKAASQRADQEAKAEFAAADAGLKAARARWQLLSAGPTDAAADDLSTFVLTSPVDGVLETLEAASGQPVAAGSVLFRVAGIDPVWVRVPVYIGDVAAVGAGEPAMIEVFGAPAGTAAVAARPVQGAPLSDPAAASADLYFELSNRGNEYRIGQKVGASLALRADEDGLVVPWSAILFDMQGGAWVYIRTAPNVFARVRIELKHVVGGLAVLGRGPAPGADVVAVGAAELFGTEFGAGK